MADTTFEFLLEYLRQLTNGEIEVGYQFSVVEKDQIVYLYEELGSLKTFFDDLGKSNCSEHEKVKCLAQQIRDVADEAECIINSSIVSHIRDNQKGTARNGGLESNSFTHVLQQIESIKEEMRKIYDMKPEGPEVGSSSNPRTSSRAGASSLEEDTVIGLEDEIEMMKERLTGMSEELEVISIVGMAGLGKTTLTRKLYNDALVQYHFYIRGWTSVSQVYLKRALLLDILDSVPEHHDENHEMSDEKLGEELYKCLKGNRYLVVFDDIWEIEAWKELKPFFPDDGNGSRIIFTSRRADIASKVEIKTYSLNLRFLDQKESWDLFKLKVFWNESFSTWLMRIGKQIAKKCQGLPLAIVVVAGLLAKTDRKHSQWEEVAESVNSYIVSEPEQQCAETLALSYNSLPNHLKPCFLYFGAFPEDYEVPVRKLIWLWIAEGFIHQIGAKKVEDVAEDYLMDLIDRNLVLAARTRSTGGVRACRVHDLVHDLCIRKVEEENFMQRIRGYEIVSFLVLPVAEKQHRISILSHSFNYSFSRPSPSVHSFLWTTSKQSPLLPKRMSFICRAFKTLRVLDLLATSVPFFPIQIVQLVLLRYLALQGKHISLPASISNLWNLETLVITQLSITTIPSSVWKMTKLRHLRMTGENYIDTTSIEDCYPSVLTNLQTICQVCPSRSCQNVLARTPNIRKLEFSGGFDSGEDCFWFPDLDFLNHLETLKLFNRYVTGCHRYSLQGIKFPPNLKRLTLSDTALEWKEMSIIGKLPNLEVLKLEFQACVGPWWETSDGGFLRLKFLRFYDVNIKEWKASSTHFPRLQRLELHSCVYLNNIPSELADISTLQIILISRCSYFAENSAWQIQKEQKSMGNDWLKIFINPASREITTYSQACV